jgi:hypothetical protein
MERRLPAIAVAIYAALLVGADSCNPPELVAPKGGSTTVENVLSPVLIRTSGLEGVGRIEALMSGGDWTLLHLEPGGSFTFNEPLPGYLWHCSNPGGTEGCVARLRVAHDAGPVGPNVAFGQGTVHVCTENYVQRQGRTHCGSRELRRVSGSAEAGDIWLPPAKSRAAEDGIEGLPAGAFSWRGDPWSRLLWGFHEFKHAAADSPPTGAAAEEQAGLFFDYRWDPDAEVTIGLGVPDNANWKAYSMDMGACSFFVPWEWQHRLEDAYYTSALGDGLGNRGLAERFLDEMIDTAEPVQQYEVNAMLWVDATLGIVPNENASPEFHYRLSQDEGEPQICFKQYFHASSDISTQPDHWYRFDQAIGAFFLELLPFVGQCGSKNVSFRYCGTPKLIDGAGAFEVDQSSVRIEHQGYPWGKVLCNNQFVPAFIDGVRATFAPGGEGAEQIDAGVAALVDSLEEALGIEVRRIESSPRGMYLITAESTTDPQYGLGDCGSDLDRGPLLPSASRPSETYIEYRTRGVTRF